MSRRRTSGRRWIPWLVALAILGYLLSRVRLDSVAVALAEGPYLALALYVFFEICIVMATDAYATRVGLRVTGIDRSYRDLLWVRGITQFFAMVNYALGQGGLGYYLGRTGVPLARAGSAVLFVTVITGLVLTLLAGLGAVFAEVPTYRTELLIVLGLAVAAGLAYLALIARPIRWLNRRSLLESLFAARLRGHAEASLARLPHLLVTAVLHWGAFRVWGIVVPFQEGVAAMPLVLLVAALPVTPGGLGTSQALQILFFSHYAQGDGQAAREGIVLAFSLVHYVLSVAFQAGVGFFSLSRLQQGGREVGAG